MLILHQNREQLHQITQLICQLLEALGLMVNQKKSITNPTQELEFLGFQVGSISMNLSIPSEKLRKIRQDARRMLDCPQVTVREVARFVGKAVSTLRAIPLAPLHYRALQMLMNSVLPLNYTLEEVNKKYETFLTLTAACKADLTWWVSLEQSHLGTPVCPPCPTVTVHLDASNKGWGAVLNGQTQTGGQWSPEEATHYINYLELLAAFLAIKAFGKTWQGVTVSMHIDSITAVSYIYKSERRHNLQATVPAGFVNLDLVQRTKDLPPGRTCTRAQADEESRTLKDRCDWMLNQSTFHQIVTVMGALKVDLFASCLTRQLPRFYSWRPDPEAEATDAFMQDWSACRGYAIPPWCLIPCCLTKVKLQAARLVLITPLWKTQPWYPIVLELLEDYPRRIPQQEDLVLMLMGQEFLMQQGVPQLIAWPISIHHEGFLTKLQTSCLHLGGAKQTPTMVPPLLNGLAGVSKGVEIPFLDL